MRKSSRNIVLLPLPDREPKIESSTAHGLRMLPTPEQILELAPKKSHSIHLDANVIAYFGDLIINLSRGLTDAGVSQVLAPVNSSQSSQSCTASAQDHS
jgi:hypothetical protein